MLKNKARQKKALKWTFLPSDKTKVEICMQSKSMYYPCKKLKPRWAVCVSPGVFMFLTTDDIHSEPCATDFSVTGLAARWRIAPAACS